MSSAPPGMEEQPPLGLGPPQTSIPAPPQGPAKPDRREFDNRRVKARFLDWLVWLALYLGARFYFIHSGVAVQTWHLLALLAINATYFFICESVWGQTMGKRHYDLRVVSTDGGTPSLNAIATRNVVRIVEEPVIALLVMLGSRGRRQRVGDLMSGTAVIDATGTPAPQSRGRMLLAYPAVWAIGLAVFAAATSDDGGGGNRYPTAPLLAVSDIHVGELTPAARRFADVVNKSCRDGVHAQLAAMGEIEHAAKAAGTPPNRIEAVGDRALADELEAIIRRIDGLSPPAEISRAYRRWLAEAKLQVRVLRQIALAREASDDALTSQIINDKAQELLELTQLGGELGFDECLPHQTSLEPST